MGITLLTLSLLLGFKSPAAEPSYLYRASFVQAAPGKLLDLIALEKSRRAEYAVLGDEPPLWIRHSQGDKWDLLLLYPMSTYEEYYRPEKTSKRTRFEGRYWLVLREYIAWQEDLFVLGPPLEEVRAAFANAGFFHLEIFQSLPGKQSQLYKERQMENNYQRALKRPENLIFIRDQGAAWDLFTLGSYRDIRHYAESSAIPEKDQDAAAKSAGFGAAVMIGPFLRRLIAAHHDTLAVAVK